MFFTSESAEHYSHPFESTTRSKDVCVFLAKSKSARNSVHGCLPDYASFPNGQPDIHYPGVADMRTISFNDLTSSFRCYPTSSGAATEL